MLTTDEIRIALSLPRNMKTRQALNRAIRLCVPGGASCLDKLEKLDYLRIQFPDNPEYAAEVGKLKALRDQLADDLRASRIPLKPL